MSCHLWHVGKGEYCFLALTNVVMYVASFCQVCGGTFKKKKKNTTMQCEASSHMFLNVVTLHRYYLRHELNCKYNSIWKLWSRAELCADDRR